MTEIPKYIDTQSIDGKIDTISINRELIDSILEKNGVNNEVTDKLYDKIINEVSSVEVDSDEYISTGMFDGGSIDEGSSEEKEFFQKIVKSRNEGLDVLIKTLSYESDINSLKELFQYDEKLSSIADSVINKQENIKVDEVKEENNGSFMDKLAKGLGDALIPGTMKHNDNVRKAYASMGYESGKMKN